MKLINRTILITGGTSGIGLELARQLLNRNNTVIVTGRDPEKLRATSDNLPAIHTIASDVSAPAAIVSLHQELSRRFPTLNTLINNAGIMRNINLNHQRPLEDITRETEVNLNGPIRMIEQFLPQLKARPNSLIVNVTSGLAFVPFPAAPIYSAAKTALHSYTQSLRIQLKGTTVRVVELAPPGVETPLFRAEFAEEMQNEKGMDPKVLVTKAIARIESGATEIRPGVANLLNFMSRIAPEFMLRQMASLSKQKG